MRVSSHFSAERCRAAILASAKGILGRNADIEGNVSARQGRIRINICWTLTRFLHQATDLRDDRRIRYA